MYCSEGIGRREAGVRRAERMREKSEEDREEGRVSGWGGGMEEEHVNRRQGTNVDV